MPLSTGVYQIINVRTEDCAALRDDNEGSNLVTIIPGLHTPQAGQDGDTVQSALKPFDHGPNTTTDVVGSYTPEGRDV